MNKRESLLLDALRFSAALVVFLNHVSSQSYTGGFLWQFQQFAQTSVMIFFVISGFVIGYVSEEKEDTFSSFSKARLARLYSVIIPALLITFVCEALILANDTEFYRSLPGEKDGNYVSGYIMSAFFMNSIWDPGLNVYPGHNSVFWSMSYEFFYYLIFGILFLLRTSFRWPLALLAMFVAGPTILSLFPVWMLGYVIFRKKWHRTITTTSGILMLSIGVVGLLCSPILRAELAIPENLWLRTSVIPDNIDGIFTACLIVGAFSVSRLVTFRNRPLEAAVRFLASLTFALYLFHLPLLSLFSWLAGNDPTSLVQRMLVIAGPLLVIAVAGTWCERRKRTVRNLLDRILPTTT